jgi:hypothetical protein
MTQIDADGAESWFRCLVVGGSFRARGVRIEPRRYEDTKAACHGVALRQSRAHPAKTQRRRGAKAQRSLCQTWKAVLGVRAERQAIGSPAAEGNRAVSDHECTSPPRFPSAAAPQTRRFCPELLSVMGESACSPNFFEERRETARPALSKRRPLCHGLASRTRFRCEAMAQRLRPPRGGRNLAVSWRIAEVTLRLCVEDLTEATSLTGVSQILLCVSAPLRSIVGSGSVLICVICGPIGWADGACSLSPASRRVGGR